MTISIDEIRSIAKLARIDLDSIKIENLERDLNKILDFVQQMDAVDTTTVEPLATVTGRSAELRDDVVTEVDARERFQAIAPEVSDGLYLVPKVIE